MNQSPNSIAGQFARAVYVSHVMESLGSAVSCAFHLAGMPEQAYRQPVQELWQQTVQDPDQATDEELRAFALGIFKLCALTLLETKDPDQ